jgi:beta-mannosidase
MPAAAALRAQGTWTPEHPRDFDADDWWYRCSFRRHERSENVRLCFEGLATVVDVWLNGTHILHSDNMFVSNTVDVSSVLQDRIGDENELVLKCHALAPMLASTRARPRWRTGLVSEQALRWHRTSLLGRMPGWCPGVAPVGPWRPITMDDSTVWIKRSDIRTSVDGTEGVVTLDLTVGCAPGINFNPHGTLRAGEAAGSLTCEQIDATTWRVEGAARVTAVERWWPHTHGAPTLYDAAVSLDAGEPVDVDLGRVGFRSLEVDRGADGDGFGVIVNGVPIFCRGVCWTPLDLAHLVVDPGAYRSALEALRTAGMNMIRISGAMTYEVQAFHDLCDELGLLVWQDLMFASMDYPWEDEAFTNSALTEATQVLGALQAHASLTVVCGNSEVDQQAAMLGLPAARRSPRAGEARVEDVVRATVPGAIWVPGTPSGGTFPFQSNAGVSHYYGVGAYRRPLDDARRADVRFAAECLAFSNVPDPVTARSILGEPGTVNGNARWKAALPRDPGSEGSFEDIRDHYLEQLFSVDAAALRASDPERYLALGRIATAEAMIRTFAEWRRPGASCRGGLVWFARDLAPGAGWGIFDSTGRPKAAYWYLKRVMAPIALLCVDEGLNGLWLHVLNDTVNAIDAELRVALYSRGVQRGVVAAAMLHVPARGHASAHADALFDGFLDLTYAYRFGPSGHDAVACTLRDASTGATLAAAHYFPGALPAEESDLGLTARAERDRDTYALVLESNRFAHAVAIDAGSWLPDDNYVHLEPGQPRRVVMRSADGARTFQGSVSALNGSTRVPIAVAETVDAG